MTLLQIKLLSISIATLYLCAVTQSRLVVALKVKLKMLWMEEGATMMMTAMEQKDCGI